MFTRVSSVVQDRYLFGQLALYTMSRIPSGMLILSLLLVAHRDIGQFSGVGLVAGVYGVVVAVAAPLVGRAADRFGARPALVGALVVHLLGVGLVLSAHSLHEMLGAAAVMGAGLPPTPACLRARWRTQSEARRAVLFTLDSVLLDVAYIVGPLLVAGITTLADPGAALVVAVGLLSVSALVVAAGRPTPAARTPRHWLGPLRDARVDRLLLVIGLLSAGLGVVEVTVVAVAAQRGTPSLAGVLLAACALGSTVGGLAFIAPSRRATPRRLLPFVTVGLGAAQFLLLAAGGSTPLLFVLLVLANVLVAPTFAVFFNAFGDVIPDGGSVEAYTWVTAVNFAATAVGTALGGALIVHHGATLGFAVAGLLVLAAAGAALPGRTVEAEAGLVLAERSEAA